MYLILISRRYHPHPPPTSLLHLHPASLPSNFHSACLLTHTLSLAPSPLFSYNHPPWPSSLTQAKFSGYVKQTLLTEKAQNGGSLSSCHPLPSSSWNNGTTAPSKPQGEERLKWFVQVTHTILLTLSLRKKCCRFLLLCNSSVKVSKSGCLLPVGVTRLW